MDFIHKDILIDRKIKHKKFVQYDRKKYGKISNRLMDTIKGLSSKCINRREFMYYFLDIDGVLNKEQDWRRPFTINPACLKCFQEIIRHDKDPHIILSSTWRVGLTNRGNSLEKDSTAQMYMEKLGLKIDGVTPTSNKTRQEEIEYYIRRNAVSNYLILDDDATLFPRPSEVNLYLTNYKTGLMPTDVRNILKKIKKIR